MLDPNNTDSRILKSMFTTEVRNIGQLRCPLPTIDNDHFCKIGSRTSSMYTDVPS